MAITGRPIDNVLVYIVSTPGSNLSYL